MSRPTTRGALTHKASGWQREPCGGGGMDWLITPTDDSGPRVVAFLSAHTWQNHANDSRERIGQDRIVLVSGAALPDWAADWLETANRKYCARARAALRAAIEDADWNEARRDSDGDW